MIKTHIALLLIFAIVASGSELSESVSSIKDLLSSIDGNNQQYQFDSIAELVAKTIMKKFKTSYDKHGSMADMIKHLHPNFNFTSCNCTGNHDEAVKSILYSKKNNYSYFDMRETDVTVNGKEIEISYIRVYIENCSKTYAVYGTMRVILVENDLKFQIISSNEKCRLDVLQRLLP